MQAAKRHVRALRRGTVLALVTALLALGGTAAYAVVTGFGGSSMVSMRAVTSTDPSFTQSTVWVDVPNAVLTVPAAAGTTIRARFSGESMCANMQAAGLNHCRTRIVLLGPAGVVEMHPQSGLDYLWDNTADGRAFEAHAMERLLRTPTSGNWQLRVQYSTTNAVTRIQLDDWTFTADVVNP